ncbi:hypothetical protein SCHPADRAFT_939415 [Schizopora paradoxa]|uniref:Uncharacterized protein n=1 Tax=Schizopora paradoxa TaxID=27342 RepID=A0A0H2RYP8_9AGAM|nr:hypothetical protein SCHPADRAFT_939415 [Schizopora paradoxa]
MSNSQIKTYSLEKYSKAIHQTRLESQSTQGPGANDLEWQHHTPANLQLQLETRSPVQGSFDSVRLKIVWVKGRETQVDGTRAQENVVYEDVDIISIRSFNYPFQFNGSPIKAVYRENMIGFRYLPVTARSASPSEYGRFQITFKTNQAADEVLLTIRDVCPCKSNAAPLPPQPRRAPTMLVQDFPPSSQTETRPQSAYMTPSRPRTMTMPMTPQYSDDHPQLAYNPMRSVVPSQVPVMPTTYSTHPSERIMHHPGAYMHLDPYPSQMNSPASHVLQPAFHPHQSQAHHGYVNQQLALSSLSRQLTQTDIFTPPNPTPPATSVETHVDSDIPPSTTGAAPLAEVSLKKNDTRSIEIQTDPQDTVLSTLLKDPGLQNLSVEDLEQLIGHVIREEGFLQLVGSSDSLFIGHPDF